jgi:2-dehydro-3-deoxygluconokinase
MPLVVTLGEILLRLSAPGHERFAQARTWEGMFGGAEANVAVAVAQLGGQASLVTRLPDHELGQRAIDELQHAGVFTHHICRGGNRLGLYFLERGAAQRPSKVIYDRLGSSFATAREEDFNWDAIFDDASWFHFSGITPALSPNCCAITVAAASAARKRGLTVSFDLNYRAKLWPPEKAGATLRPLMKYVDVCICGAAEAGSVFGVNGGTPESVATGLVTEFGFTTVTIPQRQSSSASTTRLGALLLHETEFFSSARHEVQIVDRVGAGDALTGALVFSLQRGDHALAAIEFAVAAGVLAHTIPGDFPLFSYAEVAALASGQDGGRIQR